MDAARAAMGQGWPTAARLWNDDGANEPRRSRGRMAGRAVLVTFAKTKVTRPRGRNQECQSKYLIQPTTTLGIKALLIIPDEWCNFIHNRFQELQMQDFVLESFTGQWFEWERINKCFWPGVGRQSEKVDPELSPVRLYSGVYVIAWGALSGMPTPSDRGVQYIGMTNNFKNRMSQFASSAGIHYSEKYSGHSAAWRWPKAKFEKMKVAFFPLHQNLAPHLKSGFLFWQEALAIDAYFKAHGKVPPLNAGGGEISLE